VKTDLTTYGSHLQSQARATADAHAKKSVAAKQLPIDPKKTAASTNPDYKLDLSTPTAPSAPITPSLSTPEISTKLADPPAPVEDKLIKESAKKVVKETAKVAPDVPKGSIKKPAVIFIKGLDLFSSPSKSETGYASLTKMAEAIDGSKVFGWDEKDKILEEISKTHRNFPVVLVGHSLGGDTAHEVAEELDSLNHQFRPVDLLVTIDAVGFSNDIIPQNVKNHLNVFGENNFLLNDGPHVARRHELTQVKNILSHHDHTDLDDDREIQFEVISKIQDAVARS
jgi:hypothetical protein